MVIKRGDIYYADLRPVIGSEQGGIRPVLIIRTTWETAIAHSDLRGYHLKDEQGEAAYTYRDRRVGVRDREGFGDPFGTAAHH